MEIFMMAYCGYSNKTIICGLQARGINAVGLCGMDAKIWLGRQKSAIQIVENGRKRILRGNLTGTVETVQQRVSSKDVGGGAASGPLSASD